MVHSWRFSGVEALNILADTFWRKYVDINLALRRILGNHSRSMGRRWDEDASELDVKEVSYRTTICMEDTFAVHQAFDSFLALLLAVDIIKKQLGLTLTDPDNRSFELTN